MTNKPPATSSSGTAQLLSEEEEDDHSSTDKLMFKFRRLLRKEQNHSLRQVKKEAGQEKDAGGRVLT